MPLILPEQHRYYRVIAVDPGSINFGICLFEIDFHLKSIIDIKPYTLRLDKLKPYSGITQDDYEGIRYRLEVLRSHFYLLLQEKSPAMVLCEAPFFNSRTPGAYSALLKAVTVVQSCVVESDPNTYFHLVEPLLVKKHVGSSLSGDKEKVRQALMNKAELVALKSKEEWLSYDEHSIDAIAVGYGFLKS
jgi:Holliday junction resolvasome RuvABC endonuclease subunit